MLFRKLLNIVAFGIYAAVLFTLLPQQVNAQSADELFGSCGQDQLCKDAHAAYDACVGNGNNSQACKDAEIKEDASLDAKERANTDPAAQFGYWIAQIVYVFTVGFAGVVLYMASIILNTVVSISLDSAVYGLQFVSDGWTMIRDLANMAFIFILVYIALKVMFEAHTAGTMERLIKVILVALVINFSFFATRVVIDAGNLLSIQFYNVIVSTPEAKLTFAHTPYGDLAVNAHDLTAKIMSGINFTETFKPENFQTAFQGDGASNFVTSLILFSVLYIVLGAAMFMLAAAFITAAVKFVIRIVMLWMAIVTSPLALVSWSFQGGHGHGGGGHGHESGFSFSTWWSDLIKYAFYPALFLFILLLISQFMSSSGVSGLGTNELTAGNVQSGLGGIIPPLANIGVRLAFVLVMLHYALKAEDFFKGFVFNDMAKSIGSLATFGGLAGYRKRLEGAGGAFGTVAGAGVSRSVGRVAYDLNKKVAGQRWGVESWAGRTLRKGVLDPLAKTSVGGARSYTKIEEDKKSLKKEIATGLKDIEAHELVHTIEHNGGVATADQIKAVQMLSKRVLEHFSDKEIAAITPHLSDDQRKTLQAADNLTEKQKEAMETKWHNESSSAPLQKAGKLVDEVADTNRLIGDLIYKFEGSSHKLSELSQTGNKINKVRLDALKEVVSRKADEAQVEFKAAQTRYESSVRDGGNPGQQAAAKASMAAAKTLERNAAEAVKKIEKLAEEVGKIPVDSSSGRNNKAEFNKK